MNLARTRGRTRNHSVGTDEYSLVYVSNTPAIEATQVNCLSSHFQPQGMMDRGIYRLKLLEVQAGNVPL